MFQRGNNKKKQQQQLSKEEIFLCCHFLVGGKKLSKAINFVLKKAEEMFTQLKKVELVIESKEGQKSNNALFKSFYLNLIRFYFLMPKKLISLKRIAFSAENQLKIF